jgi:serine/threonine-protein kinase
VALKLIRPEIASSRKTIERFRNEIKTARMIAHRNVCRMFDLGEEKGTYFITMEYVSGEDMKSFLRRAAPLNTGRAIAIGIQVCEGLAEAHRLGVVHRDLKPGNIMIDKEGNARIMDFGIARSIAEKGITGTGVMIGTPEYMSPEQAEGKEADWRSDIYSLGVIFYEMVTGRPPFEGETSIAVAHKHRYEPAPDPRTLNPQLPADLSRMILRCLEKEKEARYQTTGELLADFESIEATLPTTDRAPTQRPSTSRKPASSRKITVEFTPKKLLIPALVLILIVAIAAIFLMKGPDGKKPSAALAKNTIAVLPFTDISPEKDQAAWCEGIAETLLNSLANVKSLQVRGRHSSFQFTAQDDPHEVARKLNADKLLTGSLQKFGDRLRITVQLVDSATGTPDWSDKFDGEIREIFDIQDRIALMTTNRMNVMLPNEDKERLEKRYTNNQEAYDLYLKANYIARRGMKDDDFLKAIAIYLEATQKDPEFALAYVALARLYTAQYTLAGELSKEEAYRKSKEALSRAFALDSEIGEAFAVRAAQKFFFENDATGAELDYQRAFQLTPRNPIILQDRLQYLMARGQMDQALSEMKMLTEIDPLDPQGFWSLGVLNYHLHRYDDSIVALQEALNLNPDYLNAQGWIVFTYLAQGQYENAIAMAKRFEQEMPDQYLFSMALIEGSRGNRTAAEKYKKSLDEYVEKYTPPSLGYYDMWKAAYSAVLGERDRALEFLTRFYEANPDWAVSWAFYWHYYDKYRSDPGFIALFKKAGFEMK